MTTHKYLNISWSAAQHTSHRYQFHNLSPQYKCCSYNKLST